MKKRSELESLFGDARFEPDKRFTGRLKQQLAIPEHKRRRGFVWSVAGGAVGVAVLIVALSLVAPAPKRFADTVFVRDLFQKAKANELPAPAETTLWQVVGEQIDGPQFTACTNYTGPKYGKDTSIFFNDGKRTAWYSLGGYPGAQPIMRFSDDTMAPAYESDVFNGSDSTKVQQMLVKATLTDAEGKPLPADAKTEKKTNGTYDIYAHISNAKEDYKSYIAGCSELAVHIVIDAETGMYKDISIYKDRVGEQNLSFRLNQQVTTSAVTFENALPILQAAGFDLETAKQEFLSMTYINEVNKDAGFEFSYNEPVLGPSKLEIQKNESGEVTGYKYTFAKWPDVFTTIRTKASTEGPKTAEAFRAEAKAKGWKITIDSRNDEHTVPGCKAGDESWVVVATDGKMRYSIYDRTCGAFPSVYTQLPESSVQHYVDKYMNNEVRKNSPIAGFGTFAPGTEPPLMH